MTGIRLPIVDPMRDRVRAALDVFTAVIRLGDYDSNVAGMVGEIIAEEYYGMRKAKSGNKGSDGDIVWDGFGRSLQVKTWTARRVLKYKASTRLRLPNPPKADRVLLLLLTPKPPWCYELLFDDTEKFKRSMGDTIELSWNAITRKETIKEILQQQTQLATDQKNERGL